MADGQVVFDVVLNSDSLNSQLKSLGKSFPSAGKNMGGALSKSIAAGFDETWITRQVEKVASALTVAAAASFAKKGIMYNAQMESYVTNFAVLLGDEAAALEKVAAMREMAAKTPFGMEDLASATQTMLSFGVSADSVQTALSQLGDIALGDKQKMNALSLAFAQVSAAGKLTGQDLLQFVNAGFNPLQTIAEKTGASLGDLKDAMSGAKGSKDFQKQIKAAQKEVEKLGENASESAKLLAQIGEDGMISAELVAAAMEIETSAGGRFFEGMQKASQTMSGLFSTLKDDTAALVGNVFEPLSDTVKKVIEGAIGAIGDLNKGLDTLQGDKVDIEVSADIKNAQENISTLETDITDLKNKFITETITINLKAEEATNLLDRLAELKSIDKNLLTEADKQEMQSLSQQLAAINPELEKFLGKDGIINKDLTAVAALTEEYLALAKAQAQAAFVADVTKRLESARLEQGVLAEQLKTLEGQREALGRTALEWDNIQKSAAGAALYLATAFQKGEDMTAPVESATATLAEFTKNTEFLSALGEKGFDLSTIFNMEDMSLKDPSEITASVEALATLAASMAELSTFSGKQEGADNKTAEALDDQIEAIKTSITQGITDLKALELEWQATLKSLGIGEGADTSNTTGEIKEGLQSSIDDATGSLDTSSAETSGGLVAGAFTKGIEDAKPVAVAAAGSFFSDVMGALGGSQHATTLGEVGGVSADGGAAAVGEDSGASDKFVAFGLSIAQAVAKGVTQGAPDIKTKLTKATDAARSAVKIEDFNTLGKNIAQGVADGIKAGSTAISEALVSAVLAALKAAEEAAGVHSPSTLFRDKLGRWLPAGAAEGVKLESWQLRQACRDMVNDSLSDMKRYTQQEALYSLQRDIKKHSLPVSFGWQDAKIARGAAKSMQVEQTNNFNVPVQTPDEFAETMQMFLTYGLEADW